MWNLTVPWYELTIRTSVVFLSLFIMFRFFGKKHLGEMAAFDFILLLIISEAIQNSLVGDDKSIPGGLIVVLTLMVLTAAMNILAYRSRRMEKIIDGEPKVLIRNGFVIHQMMKKEKLTEQELYEAVREQGVMDPSEFKLATIEANGRISVIKNNSGGLGQRIHRNRILFEKQVPI